MEIYKKGRLRGVGVFTKQQKQSALRLQQPPSAFQTVGAAGRRKGGCCSNADQSSKQNVYNNYEETVGRGTGASRGRSVEARVPVVAGSVVFQTRSFVVSRTPVLGRPGTRKDKRLSSSGGTMAHQLVLLWGSLNQRMHKIIFQERRATPTICHG